ncbi:MAG: TraR/DksA C4-type zinc finger protein, partial [Parafilimonas sp.]
HAPLKPAPKKVEPPKEVKIPKTSIKTSLPYKPEYKSMEHRKEIAKVNIPLVRYNDSELGEFRELILKKMDAAKRELGYLQGLITRKDDMGGDESENRYMTMEDGSISMEREQLSQMASRQITYIDHLEKAVIRIENKTYGICRVTGKLIDKARLRAVPHATLSLEAKLGLVKAGE